MPEFDPYLKWLGIRESNRPINHYRLLGLDLFETDADVISMAADRQMAHIRTYQNGPNGKLSQDVLNQLARARRCLLMPEKKAEYDAQLKHSLEQTAETAPQPTASIPIAKVVAPTVVPTIVPATSQNRQTFEPSQPQNAPTIESNELGIQADRNVRAKIHRREKKQFIWAILGWISGGVAAVGVAAALIGSGLIGNFRGSDQHDPDNFVDSKKPNDSNPIAPGNINRADPEQLVINNLPAEPAIPKVQPKHDANLFEPAPELTQYSITNLSKYPRVTPEHFEIFGEARRLQNESKVVNLQPSADSSKINEYQITSGNGLLIGLYVETDDKNRVCFVQPIIHDGFKARTTDGVGIKPPFQAEKPKLTSLAKPGYAVSSIDVTSVKPITCFRLTFMKIEGSKLDPSSKYSGPWIGRRTGPYQKISNANSLPIVGIFGDRESDGQLLTLSLTAVDKNFVEETIPPAFVMAEKPPANSVSTKTVTETAGKSKLPVPTPREKNAAKKRLPDSIFDILKDNRSVGMKQVAARRLLDEAEDRNDTTAKFLVLQYAEETAIDAGDAELTLQSVREIDNQFEIVFWKRIVKSIDELASNLSPSTWNGYVDTVNDLIDLAKADENFSAASKLATMAARIAKRAKASELKQFEQAVKEIKFLGDLHEDNQAAIQLLNSSPDDPKANLDRGLYLFASEDKLEMASRHWLKSDHSKWKAIAELELEANKMTATQTAKLAGLWRKLVKTNKTMLDQKCLDRAYTLFNSASRRLKGSEKQKIDDELDSILEMLKN